MVWNGPLLAFSLGQRLESQLEIPGNKSYGLSVTVPLPPRQALYRQADINRLALYISCLSLLVNLRYELSASGFIIFNLQVISILPGKV